MSDLSNFQPRASRFAVVGHPVAHSKSPQIHQAFARQCGLALEYQALALEPDGFEQGLRNIRAGGFAGVNVTVPFKQAAWRLSDRLSERACTAQAVNTLSFEDEAIVGDNTDGVGLLRDLEQNLTVTLAGSRVLVIGAGGAAQGILQALLTAGPAELVIANRTGVRAQELAVAFAGAGDTSGVALEDLAQTAFEIVINATSASLAGEVPVLPQGLFAPGALAYDLVYANTPTAFLHWAHDAGAGHTADGLGMLVEQAAESFWIWHGQRPHTRPVIAALRGDTAG